MHPLSSLTASGHASSVTPGADAPSPSPSPPPPSSRQPVATSASAASSTPVLRSFTAPSPSLCGRRSVAERPALPVVADPDPDAEEPAGLEQQEADDEQPVEDRLELVDVGGLGHLGGDDRQVRRQLAGQRGQQRD